jgi:hypothetical protein
MQHLGAIIANSSEARDRISSMVAAFLHFYRQVVFVHEISGIFWFQMKTKNFSFHKEYSTLQEGAKEFILLALQAFCQEDEVDILVVNKNLESKIILSTRLSNFKLSGNIDKSWVGYALRDLCRNYSDFYNWQMHLEEFGWAKKSLDIISPDGQSCGKIRFYAETVPDTNLYFCSIEPMSTDTITSGSSFFCSLPVPNL